MLVGHIGSLLLHVHDEELQGVETKCPGASRSSWLPSRATRVGIWSFLHAITTTRPRPRGAGILTRAYPPSQEELMLSSAQTEQGTTWMKTGQRHMEGTRGLWRTGIFWGSRWRAAGCTG